VTSNPKATNLTGYVGDDVTSGYSNIIMQQGSGCIVEAAESSHTFKPEKDCEESKGRQSTEETEKST